MPPTCSRRAASRGRCNMSAPTSFEGPQETAILSQQIVNGLMLGSIYAMVAVALTLSIGILRFLNFSIPGLFMLGAMTVWAMVHNAIPWPLAAGAALLIAAAASLVVELFTWRRMRMAEHFIP